MFLWGAKIVIKGDFLKEMPIFVDMENLNIHFSKSIFRNKIVYIGLFIAFVVMLLCYPNEG